MSCNIPCNIPVCWLGLCISALWPSCLIIYFGCESCTNSSMYLFLSVPAFTESPPDHNIHTTDPAKIIDRSISQNSHVFLATKLVLQSKGTWLNSCCLLRQPYCASIILLTGRSVFQQAWILKRSTLNHIFLQLIQTQICRYHQLTQWPYLWQL